MMLDPARMRRGEWLAGASAMLLLCSLLLLHWDRGRTGWRALTHLRWLVVVTIALALALAVLQAMRRAPALPSTFSMIVTVIGAIDAIALLYRVLINPPGGNEKPGAYAGLVLAIVLACAGFDSLRTEGILDRDGPAEIEVVRKTQLGR
jgi:hypothetical protein